MSRVQRFVITRGLLLIALALLTAAIYVPNLHDYFLGDDFDLIGSFYDKPASYFLRLLADNASGDAWKTWDSTLPRGGATCGPSTSGSSSSTP